MATGPVSSYRVSWPESQLACAVELRALAFRRQVGTDFLRDIRHLQHRLATAPLSFGDPIYDYPHLGLVVHHAVLTLLEVLYAVDEPRRIVYVQEVLPVPGRALSS